MPVVHAKVSGVADEVGTTRVRPTDWNAGHTVMVDLATEVTGDLAFANLTQIAATSFFGNSTGSLADGAAISVATAKTMLNLAGTNTGDQTSIVGISGTKAQFDTACTDGNFLYVGDVTQYTDEMAQDAVGAMIDGSLFYTDATPLFGVNLANNFAWTGANTQTAGSYTFSDNISVKFGAIGQIYSDGTNTIVDAVSGAISIGATGTTNNAGGSSQTGGTDDLLVDQIGLGGSPIDSNYWINYTRNTNLGRGALQFDLAYTGAGPTLNMLSKLTYLGSATNIIALSSWNQAYLGADTTGTITIVGARNTTGFFTTTAITAGGTKRLYGLSTEWSGNGGTHTNGAILRYGIRHTAWPALTLSGATDVLWGGNFGNDLQVYDDVKMIYGGSDSAKGDSYDIYNASTSDIDRYVGATKTMTWDNDAIDSWLYHRFAGKMNLAAVSASTTEGDMWADSTQKTASGFIDGIQQQMSGVIFTQTADKSVTNTVTETTIVGTGVGGLTLPANFFVAGKTIRITMSGVYSTVAVTGDTVTIKIKYGSTVLASKATTALVTGGTNLAWFSDALITCRSTGSSGTVQVSGGVRYQIAGSAIVEDELNNGAATTTLNTTTSNLLDVTVTHSAANAANSVKSLVASFEVLN